MTNQDDMILLIKSISGQANILTIPRVFIIFTKSHRAALFLSQCVYWSDRSTVASGGWFYKSYREWKDELGLNQHAVETCIKILKAGAWLETKIEPMPVSMTTFYRPNLINIADSIRRDLAETDISGSAKSTKRKTISPSIKQKLPPEITTQDGLTDPIWTAALITLRQSMNGTFEAFNPRLVAIDENPHKFTVLVDQNQPGLKRDIASAVWQGVKDLKLRRRITVALVTEWPGYTPIRRVKEAHPAGAQVNPMLAVIEAANNGNH